MERKSRCHPQVFLHACTSMLALMPLWAHAAGARVRLSAVLDLSDAVERVIGGVVNIRTLDRQDSEPQASLHRQFGALLIPHSNPEEPLRSQGSGFFFHAQGLVVTNYHVVKEARRIFVVVSPSGTSSNAEIVGFDEKSDIALLRCAGCEPGPLLRFGASEKTRLGSPVFTIGNPFGYGHTVTSGILSARGRTIGTGPFNDFLQTDAAINPGNSGGPLFNALGDVIGINTATAAAAQGISFAIPSEIAEPIVRSLISTGRAKRVWLGVYGSNVLEKGGETQKSYGVVVKKVAPKSPADKAGLRDGDVILGIEGAPIASLPELEKALRSSAEKRWINVNVFRNGRGSQMIRIAIEERPQEQGEGI